MKKVLIYILLTLCLVGFTTGRGEFRNGVAGLGKLITDLATVDTVVDGIASDTEVVGASHSDVTLAGYVKQLLEHEHNTSAIYPEDLTGVTVTSGGAATEGSKVDLIPINTIQSDYDIHRVHVVDTSGGAGVAICHLHFYDDADVALTDVLFTRAATGTPNAPDHEVITPLLSANARVQVTAICDDAAVTITMFVAYHTY